MNRKHKQVLYDVRNVIPCTPEYTSNMKEYYSYCDTGSCCDEECLYSFEIYKNEYKKEIVESLLLGGAAVGDIETVFGISKKSIDCYTELFFDLSKLHSRLDLLEYVEHYQSEFGKALKQRALSLGPSFIFYTYGKLIPDSVEQKRLLKQLFMTSAFKSLEMQNNTMTSKTAKVAMEYAKVMLAAYNAMDKILDEDSAGKDMGLLEVLTDKVLTSTTDGLNLGTEDII